jgi:hypothetical protein
MKTIERGIPHRYLGPTMLDWPRMKIGTQVYLPWKLARTQVDLEMA